jgi:predicted XRE-type DNA-binding protein
MTDQWRQNSLEDTPPVLGSGDFLADRGYTDPEEARVKIQLANQIALLMEDQNLRQADVCTSTGLKQPGISKIVNGNVSGFSVWRLLLVLKGLGQHVAITVVAPEDDPAPTLAMAL